MLIEIYKGVEINHDAAKDEFFTKIVINKRSGKPDEVIRGGRLGKVRDEVDKYLNTAAKKPIVKRAWYKGKYADDPYEKVDLTCLNTITGTVMVTTKDGKVKHTSVSDQRYRDDRLFISCKENEAIIANISAKEEQIRKIKNEISCSSGKLIPCKPEHFI